MFFVGIQSLFLTAYLLIDLFIPSLYALSSILKYCSMIVCFLFTLYTTLLVPSKKTISCLLAILLTLAADFFLLFTKNFIVGVTCFAIIQILYFYYCEKITGQFLRFSSLFRLFLRFVISLFITLILILLGFTMSLLVFITIFYILNFLDNILILFSNKKTGLFFLGMLLFFACDLSVGLFNLSDFIDLPATTSQLFSRVFGVLMWTFYLPGQVLMALGIRHESLMQ